MRLSSLWNRPVAVLAALLAASPVAAQQIERELPIIGIPEAGAISFQPAASEIARDTFWLDNMIFVIIAAIVLLVLGLLLAAIVLYNHRRNTTPARFTHNSPVEIAWTVVPILVCIFIGAFSLPVLFEQQEIPEDPDVVIKATGFQWYWGYEYPEHEFGFESFMLERDQLEEFGYPPDTYQLATDTAMVVPVDKTVVVQVTGADVIHSWFLPSFGVKQDGVPGRLAELWFRPEQEGIYFGQCTELCGIKHAYMPITVKVVSEEEYLEWLDGAIEQYAGKPRDVTVASAE